MPEVGDQHTLLIETEIEEIESLVTPIVIWGT